jgi:multiple sugar transport system substrate-binding protein
MKKTLVALILFVALIFNIFAMTGCDKIFDFRTEITFYHTMGANLREVLDVYIKEFEAMYPDYKITATQEGGYDDVKNKIGKAIIANNQPNIAYCYPDHVASYNMSKKVVPLDNYINSTETVTRADGTVEMIGLTQAQKDDFITAYYEEGRQFGDGKMYTMPFSKSTEVLYYNKTFFEQHNLQVPTTWDEMEAVMKRILEIDSTCIPLGYDSEANWFITMCEQYGSDYTSATVDNELNSHYLFDNETNRAFVKRFAEWYKAGYVTTQEIYGAYTSGLFVSQTGTKSYMSIGSSAGANHQRPDVVNGKYPFEVGIASIPQVDPANPKVISQGPSVCIFTSKNITEDEILHSWLFVKYLTTSVEFQAEFSMASGYMPVLKSVVNNPAYKAFLDSADGGNNIAALSAKTAMEQVDAYYTSPAFNGSSAARDEVGKLLENALANKVTTDSEIKKLFKDALAECKKFGDE